MVEEKEVDPDTLLTTMGLAAGSVVSGAAGKPGTLRGADMQQNLKFPAQCTVIPAEELEQISGGAPAW